MALIDTKKPKEPIMHEGIKEMELEIIRAFNSRSKNGINKIKEIGRQLGMSPEEISKEIADFFHQHKENLDLKAVGLYLADKEPENQQVLQAFTNQMNFKEKGFVASLRTYLKEFQLPGESQQIERIVQSFSQVYIEQNPNEFNHADAAFVLSYQVIMLQTDLHNPSVANKMTVEGLKRNLRGLNKAEKSKEDKDFDPQFIEQIYKDVNSSPFKWNFSKTIPGYELTPSMLNKDPTFNQLNSLLHPTEIDIQQISGIGNNVTATVDKPQSWLSALTGYEGTITLTDNNTKGQATVQIYNPSIFSKYLFGEEPRVIIQPVYVKGKSHEEHLESIHLASKVAANFSSPPKNIQATYDYEMTDLITAYDTQKKLATIEKNQAFKQNIPKDPDNAPSVEQGATLKR